VTGSAELRRMQRWFASGVTFSTDHATARHGGHGRQPARSPDCDVGRRLVSHPDRPPSAAIGIYREGYFARLVHVLRNDFGCVHHVLGDAAFTELATRYVVEHPSRHPNLNQLGREFPAFAKRQDRLEHRALVGELAVIERYVCEAFDAPEFTPLGADELAAVPADRWQHVGLVVNPSLHLCSFDYPANAFYESWRRDRSAEVPEPRRSWLAVFRSGERVQRRSLSRAGHGMLSELASGAPLAQALAAADPAEPVAEWFQKSAAAGLFTAIRT